MNELMETTNHIIFDKNHPFFSLSSSHSFYSDGHYFQNLAVFILWNRALFLEEDLLADEILNNQSDWEQYREDLDLLNNSGWSRYLPDVLKKGLRLKLQQNQRVLEELVDTDDKILGFAPNKDIGIGLRRSDSLSKNLNNWKGTNLLGKYLMEFRDKYINGKSLSEQEDKLENDDSESD